MKPIWNDAPQWAQWLAMDANGRWWWYAEEPRPEVFVNGWRNPWGSRVLEAGSTPGRTGWSATLEQRP